LLRIKNGLECEQYIKVLLKVIGNKYANNIGKNENKLLEINLAQSKKKFILW
jgi:hypothetical protein